MLLRSSSPNRPSRLRAGETLDFNLRPKLVEAKRIETSEPSIKSVGRYSAAAGSASFDLRSFVFRYDIMELKTAVKPFMFQHLLGMGHQTILYFDPDIQIFSRLDQILESLQDGASFVPTPHLCAPAEGSASPDDIGICAPGSTISASLVCMLVPKPTRSWRGGGVDSNTNALTPRISGSLSTRSSWTSSQASPKKHQDYQQQLAGLTNQLVIVRQDHEQELVAFDDRLVAANARLKSVLASRSWRSTAPLRWFDDAQRRVLRWLRKRLGGDE
jgi:hypothetical protein